MRTVSLITAFVASAAYLTGCGEPKKYPPGKDTVESFGDGTWSIGKTGGGPDYPRKTHLRCSETQETLVQNIADWEQDGDNVYAVGEDGVFAVLNFRTNFRATYTSADQAPVQYRDGLRRLRVR